MFVNSRTVWLKVSLLILVTLEAKSASPLTKADLPQIRSIVQEEIRRQAQIDEASRAKSLPQALEVQLKGGESESAWKLWIPFAATILGSLLALGGVLLVSRKTVETTEKMLDLQNKQKYTELVLDALKFFGSGQGTQSRSVGIGVIRANVENPDFAPYKPVWCSVLELQAMYLLTDSKEKERPDEIANLSAIVALLAKVKDARFDSKPIKDALVTNSHTSSQGKGLILTGSAGQAVAKAIQAL
jgi:hypothetical protein